MARVAVAIGVSACCMLLGACGSSDAPQAPSAVVSPRLTFGYDTAQPLQYVNRGRINPPAEPVAVEDVSFRSGRQRVQGTGTFVAASEPRVKAFVLLSAGAAPTSAYVANAPPNLRRTVRLILGSVDPIRYIALARPGSVLLEDGTRDRIVPHAALLNVVRAAPKGTTVRWYDAPHELNRAAYEDAFDWLARRLPIDRP